MLIKEVLGLKESNVKERVNFNWVVVSIFFYLNFYKGFIGLYYFFFGFKEVLV